MARYFLVPLAMTLLHVTRSNAARFVHDANRLDARLIFTVVQSLLLAVQGLILLYGLDSARFHFQSVSLILIGLVFIVVGNVLYRARRSYGHGIKNRWTLSSEKVWVQTHRAGSVLFILAGVLVIAINLLDVAYASGWTFAVLAGCLVLSYAASFYFYQKN